MTTDVARIRLLAPAVALVLLTTACETEDSDASTVPQSKASACKEALGLVDLKPDPQKAAEEYAEKGQKLKDLAGDVQDQEVAKALRGAAHLYSMEKVEEARQFGRFAEWVKATLSNIKTLRKVCIRDHGAS